MGSVVQHVTKKSSDELLSKFADDSPEEAPREKSDLRLRRKRTRGGERKSLLPAASRRSALLRRRARGIKNKPFLGTIQKTWMTTIEGISKVFVEKQYNKHKRLISDIP